MGERDFSEVYDGRTAAGLSLTRLDEYYRGTQPLTFLHPDFYKLKSQITPLRLNWPRLTVDALEERLDVEGFLLGGDRADERLWELWQANDLDEGSQQVHTDALIHGRSFVMVWPDPARPGLPRITVESAHQISVKLNPVTREIVEAAKEWQDGDGQRFRTVLTASLITRSRASSDGEFVLLEEPTPNPFGVVPIVAFVNRPSVMHPLGESEMTDVLPLADAASKLATDMMVSAEHHAMPRRWATGVEMAGVDGDERTRELVRKRWQEATAGAVWLSDSSETEFGQFTEASLDNFISAVGMLASQASALTGLPPHFFGIHSENPTSAEAIKASEAPLVRKARRRQKWFSGGWESVLRMALLMTSSDGPAELPEGAASMETIWRNPETPTIAQTMDAAVKGRQVGLLDDEAGRALIGLSPKEREAIVARAAAAPPAPPAAELPPAA